MKRNYHNLRYSFTLRCFSVMAFSDVIPVSSIYISGVRFSGHRVKPNMAGNGGPNLRQSQSTYAVFHVYVYTKNCAGGLKPT